MLNFLISPFLSVLLYGFLLYMSLVRLETIIFISVQEPLVGQAGECPPLVLGFACFGMQTAY